MRANWWNIFIQYCAGLKRILIRKEILCYDTHSGSFVDLRQLFYVSINLGIELTKS